jgi:long-chain acyl-CoA synthetase
MKAAVHAIGILDQNDLQFLWLPLSHVFGKILLALPLQMGFLTAIDGKIDKIVDTWPSSSPPSWVPPLASSRRPTPGLPPR